MNTTSLTRRTAWQIIVAIGLSALLATLWAPSAVAAPGSAHISGEVGEIVDADASPYGGYMLRYVGDPAQDGYAHSYQWDNPYIETQPEAGPVTFSGTLDLTGRESGDVSMIGLLDKSALAAGEHEFQRGAYIYAFAMANGNVKVGVSDGNTGGELVQAFVIIPAATADAGPLSVEFTVDGTANPEDCDTPPNTAASAEGCMTLTISGFPTIADSYGTVTGNPNTTEFSEGGIPGWEAYPQGTTGVSYDLMISNATTNPQNKDQCKDGGWEDYGFGNQGQCIRYVNTGQDSR